MGQAIEPAVRPLGWDWRIGMAALASFPAREVVVGTLGIIYNEGEVDADEIAGATRRTLADARPGHGRLAQGVHGLPTALSLMVFFALCCQCASTLVVIRRETRSWRWPVFTFVYMTVLAYVGALVVYQVAALLVVARPRGRSESSDEQLANAARRDRRPRRRRLPGAADLAQFDRAQGRRLRRGLRLRQDAVRRRRTANADPGGANQDSTPSPVKGARC